MAADADRAFVGICETHGKMSAAQAKLFVTKMTADKRYVRDVY